MDTVQAQDGPMEPRTFAHGINKRIGVATNLRAETVAREKSAIEDELGTIHNVVADLHNVISALEARVNPVRSEQPPTVSDHPQRGPIGSSSFYRALFEGTEGVFAAAERLRTLTRELEV